jgi:hypothetical protein
LLLNGKLNFQNKGDGSAELDNVLWFDQTLLANLFVGLMNIRNDDGGAGSDTVFDSPSPATFPGYLEITDFELSL